jgi:diguanylate cyclase (GGDEF)-like protein/PAS domain S-box-containing protein
MNLSWVLAASMARIVVIDDRVTNRNILTRLALSIEEGLQVTAYASPLEAMTRMVGNNIPDLLITDYNMPEMDGATFIQALRAKEEYADVPIMVVTVYEDREYCYKALEAGASDFLLSPVDHLEFRARAKNMLTLRRQQKLLAQRASELEQTLHTTSRSLGFGLQEEAHDFERLPGRPGDPLMVLDSLPAAISAVDRNGALVLANRGHEALFGIDRVETVGKPIAQTHGEAYQTRNNVLDDKVLQTGRSLSDVQDIELANGETKCVLVSKVPLYDGAGQVGNVLTLAMDLTSLPLPITDKRQIQLTKTPGGLPDSKLIVDRLNQELGRARRNLEAVGLLHIDLDRFKGINEAFGRSFGDVLLNKVALRLKSRLRETDSIGHLKSDEFIIIQTGIKRPDDAAELCRRLGEAFSEPFLIDDNEVHLSASIGVSMFPADGKSADTLFKNVDLAMYRAKSSGRDTYRFFASEMNIAARKAVTLERELRQALAGDQFLVYYQPQLELQSGRIIGMEALVRWNHPHRGIIRPGEFIGLAEDIGLIAPLTAWVLESACTQHRAWQDKGLRGMQLAVNLSPVQFRERGVEHLVERILRESGVAPSSLEIELTENAVIENSLTATASLRYLHQLGVTLSIDDFGTGYSSLSYVKRLPVQRLKIDRSFVQNVEQNSNDEVIVRAIINLGHSLGLKVIAEGVETEGQLSRLKRLGCDEVQGDFISPPLAADQFERRLAIGQFESMLA